MTDSKLILELTEDGSHTLFVPSLNEHYHSVHGAIQESEHVFISAALKECPLQQISIFEVGFGTGLNALLTAKYAKESNLHINYVSIEANPIKIDLIEKLNYAQDTDKEFYQKLHSVEWGREQQITDNFSLTKIEADFTNFDFSKWENHFNIVYFDAFAPDIQGEMWSAELFNSMFEIMQAKGIMTTYCAKGEVRRRMQAAGFTVERIPGPPGKREMLRARKD